MSDDAPERSRRITAQHPVVTRNYAAERLTLTLAVCVIIVLLGDGDARFVTAGILATVQLASTLIVRRHVSDIRTMLGIFLLTEQSLGVLVPVLQPDLYVPTMLVLAMALGVNAGFLTQRWLNAHGALTVLAAVVAPLIHDIDAGVATVAVVTMMTAHVLLNRSGAVVAAEGAAALERHRADHDPLTGLANRRVLMDWLDTDESDAGFVLVDLDRFKAINDTHGHAIGDAVLTEVANRLRDVRVPARGDGRLVPLRLGGDEFAVIVPGLRERSMRAAVTLDEVRRRPVEHGELRIPIDVSIGLAHRSTTEPDRILHAADVAMYRSKRHHAGPVWYDDAT